MKKLLILFALLCNATFASDQIMITENSAWVRATPPGTSTTAIYMTMMNHSNTDISLLEVTSDISERLELHTHKHVDGMMKMQQVDSIAITASGQTELKPHAEHIMVFNLEKSLKPGDIVALELTFNNGKKQTLEVPVLKEAPDADKMHSNHAKHAAHKQKKHSDHSKDTH